MARNVVCWLGGGCCMGRDGREDRRDVRWWVVGCCMGRIGRVFGGGWWAVMWVGVTGRAII